MDRRECGKEEQKKKRRNCSRKIKDLVLRLEQSLRVLLGESNHLKVAEIRLRRLLVAEHENEERAQPQQESENAQLKEDGKVAILKRLRFRHELIHRPDMRTIRFQILPTSRQGGVIADKEKPGALHIREKRLEGSLVNQDTALENRGFQWPFDRQIAFRIGDAISDIFLDDPLERPDIDRRAKGTVEEMCFTGKVVEVASIDCRKAGLKHICTIRPIRFPDADRKESVGERRIMRRNDGQLRLGDVTPSETVFAPRLDSESANPQRSEKA